MKPPAMPKQPLREGTVFSCRLSAKKHSCAAASSDGVGPTGAAAESLEPCGETTVSALCGDPGGFDALSQLQGPLPVAGGGGWQESALSDRLCRRGVGVAGKSAATAAALIEYCLAGFFSPGRPRPPRGRDPGARRRLWQPSAFSSSLGDPCTSSRR
mmetsp:Transcript_15159/g.47635  ORF Transcript_15159/g.47635 Transcript_15159/m.47635 type:complete len:157 (-) Transcript_15159:190-660(-)